MENGGRPGSWHVRPLPSNWTALRNACFGRDGHRCTWRFDNGGLCGSKNRIECDHVNRFGPDELWNLQTLCWYHHKAKSSREAGIASAERRKRIAAGKTRPPEEHPGFRAR